MSRRTRRVFTKGYSWFRLMDSIGLATFLIIGTSVTKNFLFAGVAHFNPMAMIACIFMGMLTGCGGGVIRDAIMDDVPYAFKHGSTYISAAFVGAFSFYVLLFIDLNLAVLFSMAITLIYREIISPYGFYKKIIKKRTGNMPAK